MSFSGADRSPCRHWKIAECSESTGITGIPFSMASFITIDPAATKVSLFARAMAFPASIASSVGPRPLKPTMAVSTMSMFEPEATLPMELIPVNTLMPCLSRALNTFSYLDSSAITTALTSCFMACSIRSVSLEFAVSTSADSKEGCLEITSRAWVPMDPVDPRMAIRLFIRSGLKFNVLFRVNRDSFVP
ncbi:hypothetical protein SDC9_148419 [bioreactor metagenome]|uniref:Uncharacterized protein n=1 Tax=bioreactor metagenome TaxID=1076179 RepID=A0A645EKY5_9ZZZZ